ncbi:hypothetical protein D6774_01675 [Candidatus Woesearchaeota archaeon]|nr:MAG: hypothetical protein D6774_01675 [Candidatus Woesearchaeota archaeon]
MAKVSKDIPLTEVTLRRYEKPNAQDKRELVRKLCLSSGLLQPGDSRDIIVDILFVLLQARKQGEELSSEEIRSRVIDVRKAYELPLLGTASSNIRRQIKRLRDVFFVEKVRNNYRITEFESMQTLFDKRVEQFLLQSVLERVRDYTKKIDEEFEVIR